MSQFSKKIKLTNGLTVIYEKVDTAKIVSLYLGVKTGSAQEQPDEAGLCHLIEHMVFKGTTSYKTGEIATAVESHGGELNAYTSWDQTVYYINLPQDHFKLGLKLLKEMAFDATMDATELEREKEVVIEEINRSQDSPQRILGELLFKGFYKKHAYGKPIIGTKKHVKGFTREQVLSFYRKNYIPQNMILAVCGNISETELSNSLEDTFRFTINTPYTLQSTIQEPPKKTYKVFSRQMDIKATYLEIGFPAPHLTHKDVPAMDILSHCLGEAETSLLEQTTKEKEQLVHTIYSTCYTPKHPGIFIISCLLDPKNINKTLLSIRKQIEIAKKIPFEEEKIERAKLLSRAQLVYERETCEGTAKKWITYETMAGDYRFDEKYIESVSKLTSPDIQTIAKKYLDFSKATVALVYPKTVSLKIDNTVFNGKKTKKIKVFKKTSQVKDTALYRLDNGIRVIITENHRLPLVSMKTASLGGLRFETSQDNGINHLLSNLITRCTTNFTQEQLSEKCEWLGGHLSGYTGRNSIGLSFSFLSEKLHQAIPVLSDVLQNPSFEKEDIDKEKALMFEAIKNREDNPAQTLFRTMLTTLFKGHPYQYHLLGEKASVTRLASAHLKKYFERVFVPKNLAIAVGGDVNTSEILELLNEHLGSIKNSAFKNVKLKTPPIPHKIKPQFKFKDREQAHLTIGFPGTSIYNKDKYALELISTILSGQGGRLFLELRDKQSLAYTVSTTLVEGLETGFFGTYIATEPGKLNRAIDGMWLELNKIKDHKISQDELSRAKNYVVGNQEIENQKIGSIAMQFALNEIYGNGLEEWYDYAKNIKKVTANDIQRVAQKYINPDKQVMVVVGPKEK